MSIARCNKDDVIAVGSDNSQETGRILFLRNGKELSAKIDLPEHNVNYYLTGVACDSPTHGWIVGHYGTLIEFFIRS